MILPKLLLLSLFCWANIVHCQVLPIGKIKNNIPATEVYKLFENERCNLIYHGLERTQPLEFEIIDKVICQSKVWYQIIYYTSPFYFVEAVYFEDTTRINSEILLLSKKYPNIDDRIRPFAKKYFADQETELKTQKKELDSLNKEFDKVHANLASKNLVIWDWSYYYDNDYTSFVDVSVEVLNPFRKKIKYITFTFVAFNPVGDPVRHGINGKTAVSVQGIGPIEYGDKGSYSFESVFYSKVIQTMRMTQVKIQFFDGTVKVISNPKQIKVTDD